MIEWFLQYKFTLHCQPTALNLMSFLKVRFFFATLLLVLTVSGCQQYHDVAARFNAYFLAKEKLLEVEEALYGSPQDNYHEVLDILIPIDSTYTKSQKAGFDYIIEKASLPIQWHKTSHWVDDAYLVIGKTRLYQEDYVNAVNTFKYINAFGKDPEAKHGALVWLMRSFLENGELQNFKMVQEHIFDNAEVPFNDQNLRDYHLVMAQYEKRKENYAVCVQHLEYAIPRVVGKNKKARLYYALGQMYELLGQADKAYASYKSTLNRTPAYTLWFHAKIKTYALSQSVQDEGITKETLEEAREYLDKMSRDEKNWEMRDKIFYEVASLEYRNDSLKNAYSNLKRSVLVSGNNPFQKGYSYLRLGELYYDEDKDYEKAANYYDSAANTLPKSVKIYDRVYERAAILKEMMKYLKQVQENERLLMLAGMTEQERDSVFQAEIEAEKEKLITQQENIKLSEQSRKKPVIESNTSTGGADGGWYFYNNQAVIQGKSSFLRKWGSRLLEDDWRRSNKPRTAFARDNAAPAGGRPNLKDKIKEQEKAEQDIFASIKSSTSRAAEIPTQPEDLEKARLLVQDGFFNLGKVYQYKMKEADAALSALRQLLDKYPESEFCPEAAYMLYNLCQDFPKCNSDDFKQLLFDKYPTSFYANILRNPNYVAETNLYNQEAEDIYKQAYTHYSNDEFDQASSLLSQIGNSYPNYPNNDRVEMLQAIIIGKTTGSFNTYYQALNNFKTKYPESSLIELANRLLKEIDEEELQFDQVPGRFKYDPSQAPKTSTQRND